jgi:hypothetical protein
MIWKVIVLFALPLSLFILIDSILQIQVQVLGQDSHAGLVRCYAGNLVRSQTECPSTDICPSPESNQTVTCSSSPSTGSFPFPQVKSDKSGALVITTSKPSYKFGEIVNITIKNAGTDPLTFPNSVLGLKIENSITHEKYPLFAAQVIIVLDSGGTKSVRWNQHDSFGNQVKEGNYTAFTSSGSANASATFAIVHR